MMVLPQCPYGSFFLAPKVFFWWQWSIFIFWDQKSITRYKQLHLVLQGFDKKVFFYFLVHFRLFTWFENNWETFESKEAQ